jgi:predicted N-acetyltransferase YhbS
MSIVDIRPEHPTDAAAIRAVTTAAFKNVPYSNQTEADIIDALRAAGALTVSLVASCDDGIVGHVAFSPVAVAEAEGNWYGLGPVSVKPDQQARGVGQALVRAGLQRLAALNATGCVVLGYPRYYRRFGFESDAALFYEGGPRSHFQRLVLRGPSPRGRVVYHPAFGP